MRRKHTHTHTRCICSGRTPVDYVSFYRDFARSRPHFICTKYDILYSCNSLLSEPIVSGFGAFINTIETPIQQSEQPLLSSDARLFDTCQSKRENSLRRMTQTEQPQRVYRRQAHVHNNPMPTDPTESGFTRATAAVWCNSSCASSPFSMKVLVFVGHCVKSTVLLYCCRIVHMLFAGDVGD